MIVQSGGRETTDLQPETLGVLELSRSGMSDKEIAKRWRLRPRQVALMQLAVVDPFAETHAHLDALRLISHAVPIRQWHQHGPEHRANLASAIESAITALESLKYRTQEPDGTCPRCLGPVIGGLVSVSRLDRVKCETLICADCGHDEAMGHALGPSSGYHGLVPIADWPLTEVRKAS